MRFATACLCLVFSCLAFSPLAAAEGLSREQGDAILEELRQIRILLERQPRRPGLVPQAPAPQAPGPQDKVTLSLGGDDHSLGTPGAPVTIVEYTDYQCAFCERFRTGAFPDIKKNFIDTGKVRFIKRDLPLAFHPGALKAAQAARCAGDQGKFWEMHDLLSANFSSLDTGAYNRFAHEIPLDEQAFRSCIDSDRHVSDIRASVQGAAAAGISGTPSFVIGTVRGNSLEGIRITGAQPYAVFEKMILDFLTAKPAEKAAK